MYVGMYVCVYVYIYVWKIFNFSGLGSLVPTTFIRTVILLYRRDTLNISRVQVSYSIYLLTSIILLGPRSQPCWLSIQFYEGRIIHSMHLLTNHSCHVSIYGHSSSLLGPVHSPKISFIIFIWPQAMIILLGSCEFYGAEIIHSTHPLTNHLFHFYIWCLSSFLGLKSSTSNVPLIIPIRPQSCDRPPCCLCISFNGPRSSTQCVSWLVIQTMRLQSSTWWVMRINPTFPLTTHT